MATEEPDLSGPVKQHLKKYLHQITTEIDHLLITIEDKDCCILDEFEQVHGVFNNLHMTASSYYLTNYLSPFTDYYQALSTAVQHLSERKHGALIAVQRKEPLASFIHSGIPIGGSVSYALLESVFYPGSPLHDGAVLVEDNSITSAGNVLPLSSQTTGREHLGTRHRAAIGLSERSDALVLVVSEETGRVSFALEGKLYPVHQRGLV